MHPNRRSHTHSVSPSVFFFHDTATPELYSYWHTLPLHDALPSYPRARQQRSSDTAEEYLGGARVAVSPDHEQVCVAFRRLVEDHIRHRCALGRDVGDLDTCAVSGHMFKEIRSEEHTSEHQSLMPSAYAGFCLIKKTVNTTQPVCRMPLVKKNTHIQHKHTKIQ